MPPKTVLLRTTNLPWGYANHALLYRPMPYVFYWYLCLCSFLLEHSSCRVTYAKIIGFFQSSLRWADGFEKFQRFWVKELLFFDRIGAFFENFHQKWKNASCGAQFRYFEINLVKSHSICLKILNYESPMRRVHKKPSETLGADSILRLEISICCRPRNFNWFPLYFALCSFTEMKTTLFESFKTSPYRKILAKNYL